MWQTTKLALYHIQYSLQVRWRAAASDLFIYFNYRGLITLNSSFKFLDFVRVVLHDASFNIILIYNFSHSVDAV